MRGSARKRVPLWISSRFPGSGINDRNSHKLWAADTTQAMLNKIDPEVIFSAVINVLVF